MYICELQYGHLVNFVPASSGTLAPHFGHFTFAKMIPPNYPSRSSSLICLVHAVLPHSGQNFDAAGTSTPQLAHFLLPPVCAPHSGQNLDDFGTGLLHFGQGAVSADIGAPQDPQNFVPCGFCALHFGHSIMTIAA
jgi:hypothetical protein